MRSFHVRSLHILHQKEFEVLFFRFNEVDVEIVMKNTFIYYDFLDPSFVLHLRIFYYYYFFAIVICGMLGKLVYILLKVGFYNGIHKELTKN
jgi:hypothetical protein